MVNLLSDKLIAVIDPALLQKLFEEIPEKEKVSFAMTALKWLGGKGRELLSREQKKQAENLVRLATEDEVKEFASHYHAVRKTPQVIAKKATKTAPAKKYAAKKAAPRKSVGLKKTAPRKAAKTATARRRR